MWSQLTGFANKKAYDRLTTTAGEKQVEFLSKQGAARVIFNKCNERLRDHLFYAQKSLQYFHRVHLASRLAPIKYLDLIPFSPKKWSTTSPMTGR